MPSKKNKATIQLGWKVRDVVSEIEGIAIARIEYLNGCVQFCIVPPYVPGALEVSSFYIDEVQLVKVDDGVTKQKAETTSTTRQTYGANIQPQKYGRPR